MKTRSVFRLAWWVGVLCLLGALRLNAGGNAIEWRAALTLALAFSGGLLTGTSELSIGILMGRDSDEGA